jgi:hypothetical protein
MRVKDSEPFLIRYTIVLENFFSWSFMHKFQYKFGELTSHQTPSLKEKKKKFDKLMVVGHKI